MLLTFAGWNVFKASIRTALYDIRSTQFIAPIALHTCLVAEVIFSSRVNHKTVLNDREYRTLSACKITLKNSYSMGWKNSIILNELSGKVNFDEGRNEFMKKL